MNTTAIATSAYQTLPISLIHESTTNPRRTFDPAKLVELAESLRTVGVIQPITVRPNSEGYEIIAGARRFRAARIAELDELPARILDLTDAQTLEVQIIENSQRQDVHPYEEAAGYQRLLDLPGYDVATLADKCGKSQSHIYARLTLLQLVPEVAEAFQREKITASHANLIARLTTDQQAEAFKQCWRKDWQDKEAHLLPAKHLSAWIQNSLYLPLAEATFSIEDPSLNPEAGACLSCPRRSGYNTQLFADVQGDQCFDSLCYQGKVRTSIDRELAANPELVQIVNGYRPASERVEGQLEPNQFHVIKDTAPNKADVDDDSEDIGAVCTTTRTGLVVYGDNTGQRITVCIDRDCAIHTTRRTPTIDPEWAKQQEARRKEQERREKAKAGREKRFKALLHRFPYTIDAEQNRFLIRALILGDTDVSRERMAMRFEGDETSNECAEDVCARVLINVTPLSLPGYLAELALGSYIDLPRNDEHDFLAEAEALFPDTTIQKPTTKEAGKKKTPNKAPVKVPPVAARIAKAKKTAAVTAKRKA